MAAGFSKNIRLGIMVIAATLFLIVGMYIIGDKQNLFGSTFKISAYFTDVNGLMPGHNVRLDGVDIGTVDDIEIISQSKVRVDMVIDQEYQQFISKNAVATIGTDGLMGNKLVNITPADTDAEMVIEGDTLKTLPPLQLDPVFRTLSETNDDIAIIADNLRVFTDNMNSPNSVWGLLTDTITSVNINTAISNIMRASDYSVAVTGKLTAIIDDVNAGKGAVGGLLYDTTAIPGLNKTIANIQSISDSLLFFTTNLREMSEYILNGDGAVETILKDSTFDENLQETMNSIRIGAKGLEENMEALKHNFLFRRYFKKEEKQKKKSGNKVE